MSLAAKHGGAGGLDLAGLGDLAAMLDGPEKSSGNVKLYDVDTIHEDENNARRENNPGFRPESIAEFAETVRQREELGHRGIKSPLSLRPHPTIPGHFVINHGHRRYRVAKHLGMKQVPAFEDPDFEDDDQIIENIQREDLTAREIADYLGSKLAQGRTQADLARSLGKSKGWISHHVALLNLPEPVAEAVASGQVTDVTLANELATVHRENPEAVKEILTKDAKPTRAAVKAIRRAKPDSVTPAAHKTASDDTAPERPADVEAAFAEICAQRERGMAELPSIRQAGEAALRRLLPFAPGDTNQSGVIARFLLNLYDGARFPFDNNDLRRLSTELVEDCLTVLRMDASHRQSVHLYFEDGSKIWEDLAKVWGFRDFYGEASWRSVKE